MTGFVASLIMLALVVGYVGFVISTILANGGLS